MLFKTFGKDESKWSNIPVQVQLVGSDFSFFSTKGDGLCSNSFDLVIFYQCSYASRISVKPSVNRRQTTFTVQF